MAQRTMSSPTVIVNNNVVAIVPGSLEFDPGFGEVDPKVASAGGRSIELFLTEDPTTQIGRVKFALHSAKSNYDLVNDWVTLSRLVAGNVIQLIDNGDGTSYPFSEMFVTNNPTTVTGPDGQIEIEFKGRGPAT